MVKNDEVYTRGEAFNIFSGSLDDLDEALIQSGAPREAIQSLKLKYAPKFIGEQSRFTSAATGQRAGGPISSNIDDAVPFREVVEDIKKVSSLLSSGAKSGATRFNQDDIAVAVVKNNLGKSLSNKVAGEEFAALQAEYGPTIQLMKVSNTVFKPAQGELKTKTGTQLLKRVGLGKAEAGEEKLIEAAEKGTKFAKGIGDISSEVKSIGAKTKSLQESAQDTIRSTQIRQENVDNIIRRKLIKLDFDKAAIEKLLANQTRRRQLLVALGLGAAVSKGGGVVGVIKSGLTRGQ